MTDRARRFRRRALQENGGKLGSGARYSDELRREAVEYYRECVSAGATKSSIASDLGVAPMTLESWARAAGSRVKPVIVAEDPAESGEARLTVVTASGHRVEGLTVSTAAALLRALS